MCTFAFMLVLDRSFPIMLPLCNPVIPPLAVSCHDVNLYFLCTCSMRSGWWSYLAVRFPGYTYPLQLIDDHHCSKGQCSRAKVTLAKHTCHALEEGGDIAMYMPLCWSIDFPHIVKYVTQECLAPEALNLEFAKALISRCSILRGYSQVSWSKVKPILIRAR